MSIDDLIWSLFGDFSDLVFYQKFPPLTQWSSMWRPYSRTCISKMSGSPPWQKTWRTEVIQYDSIDKIMESLGRLSPVILSPSFSNMKEKKNMDWTNCRVESKVCTSPKGTAANFLFVALAWSVGGSFSLSFKAHSSFKSTVNNLKRNTQEEILVNYAVKLRDWNSWHYIEWSSASTQQSQDNKRATAICTTSQVSKSIGRFLGELRGREFLLRPRPTSKSRPLRSLSIGDFKGWIIFMVINLVRKLRTWFMQGCTQDNNPDSLASQTNPTHEVMFTVEGKPSSVRKQTQ